MKRLIWPLALALGLSGCATFSSISRAIFGQASQAMTPPLYQYRADLQLTVDGKTFDGVGVTLIRPTVDIKIDSKVGLDRLQITSCSRQDVFQEVDKTWYGGVGHTMVYHYTPTAKELKGLCPLYIEAYEKSGLAAWGMMAFRSDETLGSHFGCNGVTWTFGGFSICQTKAGLDQSLAFDVPIDDFEADAPCGITKVDPKNFTLRPLTGICHATFRAGEQWHSLLMIGYGSVIVRGT